jgi:hypothetical protein
VGAEPECQSNLDEAASPLPPPSIGRGTYPLVGQHKTMVALTAVFPDFDRERDVVVGIRPRKHTYLVNGLIGRHDPGIFGDRGDFADITQVRWLRVSPGLVARLRLPAPVVQRMAIQMERKRNTRSLTCTNTTARILTHAGVPGMHPFIFTPNQLLRAIEGAENLDVRFHLVNASAEDLEEFKDGVKVLGPRKPQPPPPETGGPRRNGTACCDEGDYSESCMFACLDVDCCTGTSQGSECACPESGACESGACDSDSGGSDCDSDCCS